MFFFALYPEIKNQQRVSKYVSYAEKLDFTGIQFPVQIKYTEEFSFTVKSMEHKEQKCRRRKICGLTIHMFQNNRESVLSSMYILNVLQKKYHRVN